MNQTVASMILVLACAGVARADAPPAHVAPFLGENEDDVLVATGPFGPAKATTIVVSFNMMGRGSFGGFALVPDAKAAHGYRKLGLPKLPAGSLDGAMKVALSTNLDKDADDELVIELHVQRSVQSKEGGYSYGTYEYVVLDWDGKKLVRVAALEKKLGATMKARAENTADALAEGDLRAALGLPRKK